LEQVDSEILLFLIVFQLKKRIFFICTSGGYLAAAYAELIKDLWTGSSKYASPWNLKKIIGKFAPQVHTHKYFFVQLFSLEKTLLKKYSESLKQLFNPELLFIF